MADEFFSAPSLTLAAIQLPNAAILLQGTYRGKRVALALPIDHAKRCILLLESSAGDLGALKNLFCIDRSGSLVWTAELPDPHDAFVTFEMK
jgi:hypothetical protein